MSSLRGVCFEQLNMTLGYRQIQSNSVNGYDQSFQLFRYFTIALSAS